MLACEFVTPKGTKKTPFALVRDAVETVALTVATTGAFALATLLTMLVAVSLRAAPLEAAQSVRRGAELVTTTLDSSRLAPAVSVSRGASALPFALVDDATFRVPGSSRLAGSHVGAAAVDSVLSELCAASAGSIAGVQHFATGDGRGALLVLRSARRGGKRVAWHEVVVYRLDAAQRVRSLALYVEDQRAWDRRFPREDGVSRVSVATERNVERTKAQYPEARFVAGNADRVLLVMDVSDLATPQQTVLLQQTIAPTGALRASATYRPISVATLASVLLAR